MRLFVSVLLTTALVGSTAFAGETSNGLAPGKPAGVHQAQMEDHTLVIGLGLGLVAAGIAIAASSSNSHNAESANTTISTSP